MLQRFFAALGLTFSVTCSVSAQVGYPQQAAQPGTYPQAYPQQEQPPYPPPPAAGGPVYAPGYGPPGFPLPPGQAAEPLVSSAAGRVQLSLGTYAVRYTSWSQTFSNAGGEFSNTEVVWGFGGAAPVTLEGGYGITDSWVVGGLLSLGGTSGTIAPSEGGPTREVSSFDLVVAPKVDYQFLPTSKINPFVGGVLGVELSSSGAGPVDDSRTSFTVLARGGLRCFLFDGFSIDPAFVVGFQVGGGSRADGTNPAADYSQAGFRVGVSIGISGWLKFEPNAAGNSGGVNSAPIPG